MVSVRNCLVAFWAALALALPGCEDEPLGPRPAIERSPPSSARSTPAPPRPQRPRNPWSQARVGDVLEYEYSYTQGLHQQRETSRRATFVLEVVALDSPWVWVKVTLKQRTEKGPSERAFLLPVDRVRVPTPHPGALQSTGKLSRASVGATSFECQEGSIDQSATDGPVATWCDSVEPPMYLGRRLWHDSSAAGPSGSSHWTLKATRAQRGPEAVAAVTSPPTGLPTLFAPSLSYRRHDFSKLPLAGNPEVRSVEEVQEFFVGEWGVRKSRTLRRLQPTTRKDLRRTDLVKLADTWYEPSDWREAPTATLLETLRSIVHDPERQARVVRDGATEGSVPLAAGQVQSLVLSYGEERQEYAKDPWESLLDGLPWTPRIEPLVESRVRDGKQRGMRLWDWGAPPLAPTPPAKKDVPDTLTVEEIRGPVLVLARSSGCVQPLIEARKQRRDAPWYVLQLTLRIELDGSVSSVTLQGPTKRSKGVSPLPPKILRCLQADFRALRFPPHGQPLPPFESSLSV